ncbi:MAG TPA: bifunctional serine/threonine-protein kinase/formylglycine-generating enzyme family protein [Pyrinomonadaceae bacterium]
MLKFTITGDPLLDGRYQLESRIAQGGMGVVFKGRHIFLKTLHAIKVILPDLVGNDPSLVTRFRQEAMAAAAIRHPNIVAVTDFGVVNGTTPFLVMEFIQGESLSDILQREGRLEPARTLDIMTGVCAGLGAAHRQGIVHRDMKPLNIMLRDDAQSVTESVKLLDFGLAKIKSGELLGSFVAAQTTGLMGSPFYMAPEQWSDEEPDRRADVYSLGVILYQMLAGEVPFKGSSIPSIMKKHLTGEPPSFTTHGIDVPPRVEAVVLHALAKEPERRPQTVEDFVAELREAVVSTIAETTNPNNNRLAGMETVTNIRRGETTGEHRAGEATGIVGGREAAATFYAPQHTEAQLNPSDMPFDSRPTMVEGGSSGAVDARDGTDGRARGAETGRQFANRTAYQPGVGDSSNSSQGGARTGAQDRSQVAGESLSPSMVGRRAEAEILSLAEQERLRREGGAATTGAAQETQMLDAEEARRRQEEEERLRRQSGANFGGQQTSTPIVSPMAGNVTTPLLAAQHTVAPHAFAGQQQASAGQQSGSFGQSSASGLEVAAQPAKSRALMIVVGVVMAFVVLGGAAGLLYVMMRPGTNVASTGDTGNTSNADSNANANANTSQNLPPTKPDLVALPGGAFQIGRGDLPPSPNTLAAQGRSQDYLAWVYTQWPAHSVTVEPFAIDRTEVTNAEYAEFVNATGYPPPPGIWDGNRPKPGQEFWPVRNVTLEDAQRFAVWRSKRDGVQYRLPTEDEWEYAARGGDPSRLYPWGKEWIDGRANLDSDSLKAVGTFTDGATPQGVHDMIGNVWEWTSTEASMYKGNNLLRLRTEDESKVVVRGGSYQSSARGDKSISATARTWEPKDKRDPVIGFRLVRASSAAAQ